jgi:hypothetical protein
MTTSKGIKFLKQALIVTGLTTIGLLLFQFVPALAQSGTGIHSGKNGRRHGSAYTCSWDG